LSARDQARILVAGQKFAGFGKRGRSDIVERRGFHPLAQRPAGDPDFVNQRALPVLTGSLWKAAALAETIEAGGQNCQTQTEAIAQMCMIELVQLNE
jgi:hypothetical protein